jgi:hypothetical protein
MFRMKKSRALAAAGTGVAIAGIALAGALSATADPAPAPAPPAQEWATAMEINLSPQPVRVGDVVKFNVRCNIPGVRAEPSDVFRDGMSGSRPSPFEEVVEARVSDVPPGPHQVEVACGNMFAAGTLNVVK